MTPEVVEAITALSVRITELEAENTYLRTKITGEDYITSLEQAVDDLAAALDMAERENERLHKELEICLREHVRKDEEALKSALEALE